MSTTTSPVQAWADSSPPGEPLDYVCDVRNYAQSIALPHSMDDMDRGRTYAVPMDTSQYPDEQGIILTTWKMVLPRLKHPIGCFFVCVVPPQPIRAGRRSGGASWNGGP